MAIRIVSIIVDEDPRRPAFAQHSKNLAQTACRIRPVVCRLDRNRSCEKIRVPGNFIHAADDEHRVLERDVVSSRAAHHFVGNIHADNAPFWHAFGKEPLQPSCAAAHVEDIVFRRQLHQIENRQRDRKMVFFHLLAAALFSPAIEFFTQRLVVLEFRHRGRLSGQKFGKTLATCFEWYWQHRLQSLCAFPVAQTQTTQTEVCATCGYCSIFARSSTNFCWRWDWSLPSSDSACCVMFIEQNFGPHIEQNFASL